MSMSAALDLARMFGFAVFPVGPDCRQPLTEHGCKDASADPAEIQRMWAGRTSANVALATGLVSGVFALDIDCKGADGFLTLTQLEDDHGSLPATWASRTPSGGQHLLFRQPDRILRNRVGFKPGLDVRTSGGSIALPPSKKPIGAYEWMVDPTDGELADAPGWLLNLIDPPEPPRPPAPAFLMRSYDRAAKYVAAAVNGECTELSRMGPNSGRNLRLFQASANLGNLVGANMLQQQIAEDVLELAAHECGLVRDDGLHAVRATIRSGIRKGITEPREVRP